MSGPGTAGRPSAVGYAAPTLSELNRLSSGVRGKFGVRYKEQARRLGMTGKAWERIRAERVRLQFSFLYVLIAECVPGRPRITPRRWRQECEDLGLLE